LTGINIPGEFSVRPEEIVDVGPAGARVFSQLLRDINVVPWGERSSPPRDLARRQGGAGYDVPHAGRVMLTGAP